jgi:hypothetical protein
MAAWRRDGQDRYHRAAVGTPFNVPSTPWTISDFRVNTITDTIGMTSSVFSRDRPGGVGFGLGFHRSEDGGQPPAASDLTNGSKTASTSSSITVSVGRSRRRVGAR